MNDTASSHVKSLAVSLSGGGHRATLFVLGALMYLADAKANAHVTSIASVSGGSLTNGFVGQTVNFREIDGSEFRKRVAGPLATQIAKVRNIIRAALYQSLSVNGIRQHGRPVGAWLRRADQAMSEPRPGTHPAKSTRRRERIGAHSLDPVSSAAHPVDRRVSRTHAGQ